MSAISGEALRRLDAVVRVGLRVAQSARSGRVALAQLREQLEDQWIARPWGDDIAAALDEAARLAYEPLPLRDVERVLRDAWDARPSDELDDLEPEPAAVTPGAQVHRATLDGRPVAVKVLRPGLASSVRQDLTLLEALSGPLEAAFPAAAIGAAIGEVRERVLDELDLETEATVQRRFHRALRGHPFLSVPAPVTALCRESVKVAEWVEGVPLWHAPDRGEAAARLVVFVLGAARWGVAYADPSPENVLVREDGGLAVVDFGACREIDGARLADATAVLEALSNDDAATLAWHLDALG